MRALFDTVLLVDFLRGLPEAGAELRRYQQRAISVVTWIEIMVGADPTTAPAIRSFLTTFERIDIDEEVAEDAVLIRRETRIKLPDAVIWASARCRSMLLVTRNTRDFPVDDPGVRVPYRLS